VVVADLDLIKRLKDLISLAKAKPKQLLYGSGGVGNITHLEMELLNAVTDSMTLIDNQGRILALNQAAVHRFGKKRDELMGMNLYELLPPRSAKELKLGVDKVIDSRKPLNFEYGCVGHIFDKTMAVAVNQAENKN